MLKILRIFFFALLATLPLAGQVYASTLDWEIERNFRYFQYPSDVAIQRVAFDISAQTQASPTVEDVELLLNDPRFWTRTKLDQAGSARSHWPLAWNAPHIHSPYDLLKALRAKESGRAALPDAAALGRRGWASLLVRPPTTGGAHGATDTCWDPNQRLHLSCKVLGDYVRPEGWVVRIFDTSAPVGECSWSGSAGAIVGAATEKAAFQSAHAANKTAKSPTNWKADNQSCQEIRVFVPSDPSDPHGVRGSITVTRSSHDGADALAHITPSDALIVGFADSFGSGEGNPERGAVFSQSSTTVDKTYLPARRDDNQAAFDRAQWTDRWCHRSVYSWQIRTALHLSQLNRKRSVTVLPYGCSGAEVFQGLLYSYQGVETDNAGAPFAGHSAQLALAYQELCKTYYKSGNAPPVTKEPAWQNDDELRRAAKGRGAFDLSSSRKQEVLKYVAQNVARCEHSGPNQFTFKRKVDMLLMIAGINDIGFSKWVSAAITTKAVSGYVNGFIPKNDDPETKLRLARLHFRYEVLREALDKHFLIDAGLADNAANGSVLKNVIMPLYPRALEDVDGKPCAHGNQGMTVGTFPSGNDTSHSCKMYGFGLNFFDSGVFSLPNVSGPVLAIRDQSAIDAIELFRDKALDGGVSKFAASEVGRPGYTVVSAPNDDESTNGRFVKRGFCATQDKQSTIAGIGNCVSFLGLAAVPKPVCWISGERYQPSENCIADSAESMHVARNYFSKQFGSDKSWADVWRPFAAEGAPKEFADKFYPYAHRTRLFRTPNDVYMLIDNRPTLFSDTTPPGILDIDGRGTSGAFHPTAEAHSIISSMTVQKALAGPFK